MATLIPNGIYRFRNVAFTDRAVDLIDGVPRGPVSGFLSNTNSASQRWRITNIGNNRVTMESIAAPSHYVNAPIHARGVALDGDPNPTIWTVVRVVGSPQVRYCFQSPNAELFWTILGDANYASIVLKPIDGEKSEWTAQSV